MNEPSSRRTFLKRLGTVAFAAVIVDATIGNTTSADCPCGGGVTDAVCYSVLNEWEVCLDPDENCGTNGDTDEGCVSWSGEDENCGQGPEHSDTDQSCTSAGSATDENCYIQSNTENAHDEDQNCTAANDHTDNACGDCNDNHDSDEHCAVTGTADSDQMCGHQHFNNTPIYAPIDSDDVCENNYTVPDVGCGVHDNGFGGGTPATDADDNCDRSQYTPDQNCAAEPPDSYCEQQQNSSQPDESCSSTNSDEACIVEWDSDEHCGTSNDSDEHCFDGSGLGHDEDQNCGQVAGDTDEACSYVPWDWDNA